MTFNKNNRGILGKSKEGGRGRFTLSSSIGEEVEKRRISSSGKGKLRWVSANSNFDPKNSMKLHQLPQTLANGIHYPVPTTLSCRENQKLLRESEDPRRR